MKRRQVFVDEAAGVEVVLPVTPGGYAWEHGIHLETVNIDALGDLVLPGHKALDQRTVECFFPAHAYPFNEPETVLDPFWYVERFQRWADGRQPVRYIVTGTPLNASVYIQSIKYAEQDGTNDVYAVLTLREHMAPEVLRESGGAGTARSAAAQGAVAGTYVVQAGDTLSAIARKFYGDAAKCWGLAEANGIANADLIHPGQVLQLPAAGQLPAGAGPRCRSEKAAAGTVVKYDAEAKRYEAWLAKKEAAHGGRGV